MNTSPRNFPDAESPAESAQPRRVGLAGRAWRITALLAIGGGAFFGFELIDSLLMAQLDGVYQELPQVEPPATRTDAPVAAQAAAPPPNRSGNAWLLRARQELDNHASVEANLTQSGRIESRRFRARGEYVQSGLSTQRRFTLMLRGEIAGEPAQLLRVGNPRYVWTDLLWAERPAEQNRSISRIDLRQVRRALRGEDNRSDATGDWSRRGGLPMLLDSLDRSFNFSAGRLMELKGEQRVERVVALVGRWSPTKLARLSGKSASPPRLAPHHVVIALSEETLFPRLIEYRSAEDPLSDDGMLDTARLRPSRRPMLKIAFSSPRFDRPIDPARLEYRLPEEADFIDRTERELQLVRAQRKEVSVASAPGAPLQW